MSFYMGVNLVSNPPPLLHRGHRLKVLKKKKNKAPRIIFGAEREELT
jgi:hypothetical protein